MPAWARFSSLAVSLVRRARDIVLGVPVLLIWQYVEVRRMRGRRGLRPSTSQKG
jgi:hypothetical protein